MKTTVSFFDFKREFKAIRPNNFTDEGLIVLWDYLVEYEDSTCEELELDVIALCCDYIEQTLEDFNQDYAKNEKMNLKETIEYLSENTIFLGKTESGTIIYQLF